MAKHQKLLIKLQRRNNMQGIYIVELEMCPGIYKIGMSSDIDKRIKSFKTDSIVVGEVHVHLKEPFKDYVKAEKDIHELLKEYRMSDNREFFKGDLSHFIKVIKDYKNKIDPEVDMSKIDPIVLFGDKDPDDVVTFKDLEKLQNTIYKIQYAFWKVDNELKRNHKTIFIVEEMVENLHKILKADNNYKTIIELISIIKDLTHKYERLQNDVAELKK